MAPTPRSPADGVIIASLLQHCLDAVRRRGLEPARVSQLLGIDLEAHIADPTGWVPVSLFEEVLRKVLALYPDPLLGLHASAFEDGAAFGVTGYLAQTCATLEEVFTATMRYERLVSDIGTTALRRGPGIVYCCWECSASDPLFRRHAAEFLLASWIRHIRLLKEPPPGVLLAVHFRHEAPQDSAVLKEYEQFFGCPVKFGQPESALLIPAPLMHHRLRNPNPSLQEMLERHARLLLAERNTAPSLVEQIRARLRMLLMQGAASREQLADELGISARHLHRQLQKAGSSYRELVDDLRIELAKTLLQDATLTVEAIALRLAYADSGAFIRWFRQQTGQTPGEFRQARLLAAG